MPIVSLEEGFPHFKGSSHPEWEDTLAQFINLKIQKKSIEAEIGELESHLKVAYQLSHTVKGEWINTGNHTFRVIPQNGRVTLDRKRLNEEVETLLGEQKAQTLMAKCETPLRDSMPLAFEPLSNGLPTPAQTRYVMKQREWIC